MQTQASPVKTLFPLRQIIAQLAFKNLYEIPTEE